MTALAITHRAVRSRRAQLIRQLTLVVATLLMFASGSAAIAAPSVPSAACAPGSGPQLSGRHLNSSEIQAQADFRCADLQDADLTGLSLIQIDLKSANLRGAKLSKTDLGQADLTGADLSGADLSGAGMIQATLNGARFVAADLTQSQMSQVEARSADFTGADLSGADLSQAELNDTHFDGASLDGTDFTQATLAGTSFTGVTGVTRWDKYLLVGCVALYLLLSITFLTSQRRRKSATPFSTRVVGFGLLGRLMIVLGIHLFSGALLGLLSSALGSPVVQLCSGPQCAVGVGAGSGGPFIGVVLIIFGVLVGLVSRTRRVPRATSTLPPPAALMYRPYSLNR